MMNGVQLVELIKRVGATKKVANDNYPVIVTTLVNYLNYFSCLKEDDISINGRVLSEWDVPNCFKDLIDKSAVRYDPSDRAWKDLALHKEECYFSYSKGSVVEGEHFIPNYDEYCNLLAQYRGLFKLSVNENMTSLNEVKKVISLSDAINKASIDGKVWYMGDAFWPIPLCAELAILDRYHYIIDEDSVKMDFIRSINLEA